MYVAHERRAYLLRLLQQRGSLRTAETAEELGVTDETIRTDFVAMQAQGLLQRVHGGARYILPQGGEEDGTRADCQLADLAAAHLKDGACLYLDDAPTSLAMLTRWSTRIHFTLLVPSLRLGAALSAAALPHRLLCPGGEADKSSGLLLPPSLPQPPDAALLCPAALTPEAAWYPTEAAAAWAAVASAAAGLTFLVLPADALLTAPPEGLYPAEVRRPLLLTADALPEGFESIPCETIPYLSAATLLPEGGF